MAERVSRVPISPPGFVQSVVTDTYVIFERRPQRQPGFSEELWFVFGEACWAGQVSNWDDLVSGGDGGFYHSSGTGTLENKLTWFDATYEEFLDYRSREFIERVTADAARQAMHEGA
jgi:hypothetical protein